MKKVSIVSRVGCVIRNSFFSFVAIFFLYIFLSGVSISYNPERTVEAKSKFWRGTLKLAGYVGDVSKVIGR